MNNTITTPKVKTRIFILIGVSLFFILSVISSLGITINEDIMTVIPKTEETFASYKELLDKFDPLNKMYIDFKFLNEEEFDENILIQCADSFFRKMEESGHFNTILYHWTQDDLLKMQEILRQNQIVLYSDKDIDALLDKISIDKLREHILEWKKKLMQSPDPFTSKQFVADPIGLDEILMNKIQSINSINTQVTINKGRFFSRDLKHILIISIPNYKSTDSHHSKKLIDFMSGTINFFKEEYPEITISYLSGHRFSLENATKIKNDIQFTITVSLSMIIILSFLAYTRPYLILLTILPAIFGTFFSLGFLRWIDPSISAIIVGCGAMLIGISVDYGIHYLFHLDHLQTHNSGPGNHPVLNSKSILRKIRKPLIISALTTIVAFLALNFSIFPAYKQLSLFVAAGISGALLFVILVMPLLIPAVRKKPQKKPILPFIHFFPLLYQWLTRYKWIVLAIVVIFSIFLLPGFLQVEFEGDVTKLNSASPETREDMNIILNSFGDATTTTLIAIKNPDLESALIQNEQLKEKLLQLTKMGIIRSFSSIADILPSYKQQKQNYERIETNQLIDILNENTSAVIDELKLNQKLFYATISLFEKDFSPISIQSYQGTIIGDLLPYQLNIENSSTFVLTPINLPPQADIKESINLIKEELSKTNLNCIVYNGRYFVMEVARMIFSEMKKVGLISLLFVLILLFIYKRNLPGVLKLLLPLALSLFWSFGIMGWLGIKINIINSIIIVFIFGLVIDYCVFLEHATSFDNADRSSTLAVTSGAVTISALTTMAGLGALVLAQHPALHSIGITALLAIGSGLLAVLMITPLLTLTNIGRNKEKTKKST